MSAQGYSVDRVENVRRQNKVKVFATSTWTIVSVFRRVAKKGLEKVVLLGLFVGKKGDFVVYEVDSLAALRV